MSTFYKPGDRVELVYTSDAYTRLRRGDRGTVRRVRDMTDHGGDLTISVEWDSGSTLSMLPDEGDIIRTVTE